MEVSQISKLHLNSNILSLQLLLKFPQIEEGFVIIENAFNGRALDADREPWVGTLKSAINV